METYKDDRFIKDGKKDLTTDVIRCTKILKGKGLRLDNSLQYIEGLTVYPKDYFSPKDVQTGLLSLSKNTYAIHHYACSWTTPRNRFNSFIRQRFLRFRIKLGFIKKKIALDIIWKK